MISFGGWVVTMVFCGILKWPSDLTVCCGRLMKSWSNLELCLKRMVWSDG